MSIHNNEEASHCSCASAPSPASRRAAPLRSIRYASERVLYTQPGDFGILKGKRRSTGGSNSVMENGSSSHSVQSERTGSLEWQITTSNNRSAVHDLRSLDSGLHTLIGGEWHWASRTWMTSWRPGHQAKASALRRTPGQELSLQASSEGTNHLGWIE